MWELSTYGEDLFDFLKGYFNILSIVCGITYFIAWSASFYPQVYLNQKRKTVVGFSFDYLFYNFLGFFSYSVYCCAIFFVPLVQQQYEDRFGTDVMPVKFSDVLFSVHAFALVCIQSFQCFIYDRGNQIISLTCSVIAFLCWVSIIVYSSLTAAGIQNLLQLVYWLSYIKLFITLVKYIPQV